MTTANLTNLPPDLLITIGDHLGHEDRLRLSATCRPLRAALPRGKDLTEAAQQHIDAFERGVQPAEASVPERGIVWGRCLSLGTDVFLKKAMDPERSTAKRAANGAAYACLAPVGYALSVGLCASVIGAFALTVPIEISMKQREGCRAKQRQGRHDKRREVRSKLSDLQGKLAKAPPSLDATRMQALLEPCIGFIKDVGAHDRLRMKEPHKALEKVIAERQ